jgi:hypothetical protein
MPIVIDFRLGERIDMYWRVAHKPAHPRYIRQQNIAGKRASNDGVPNG